MAATQYQIFCKYFNETVNKIVSNESNKEWISAEEWYRCKIAYNVTNPSQSNALKITQDSISCPHIVAGTVYKTLYDAILESMAQVNPNTGRRLQYDNLSTEEKVVYNLCHRYEEIVKKIGADTCVIEYAMIRPFDQMSYKYSVTDYRFDKLDKERTLKKSAKIVDNNLYNVVFDQNSNNNPKYDMLFTYNGMTQTDEQFDLYKYKTTLKSEFGIMPGSEPQECFNPQLTPGLNEAAVNLSSINGVVESIPSCMYERMEGLKAQPWFYICTCNSLIAAMKKANELVDMYGKDAVKIGKIVPLDQYIEIV